MKKIFFSLFFLLALSAQASEPLSFSKVIVLDSTAKDSSYSVPALYLKMRSYVNTYFVSAKNVIQMDDKQAGKIVCRATTDYAHKGLAYMAYEGTLSFLFTMEARPGRIRIELSNFIHDNLAGHDARSALGLVTTDSLYTTKGMRKSYDNKVWKDLKEKALSQSESSFASLEAFLKDPKIIAKDKEW